MVLLVTQGDGQIDQPGPETESPAPIYADAYEFAANQYTVFLTFLATNPTGPSQRVAIIKMSPEHAKIMAILFKQNVQEIERQLGVEIAIPAQILEAHHIDLETMW